LYPILPPMSGTKRSRSGSPLPSGQVRSRRAVPLTQAIRAADSTSGYRMYLTRTTLLPFDEIRWALSPVAPGSLSRGAHPVAVGSVIPPRQIASQRSLPNRNPRHNPHGAPDFSREQLTRAAISRSDHQRFASNRSAQRVARRACIQAYNAACLAIDDLFSQYEHPRCFRGAGMWRVFLTEPHKRAAFSPTQLPVREQELLDVLKGVCREDERLWATDRALADHLICLGVCPADCQDWIYPDKRSYG
jgi:hypothetical protein